MITCKPTASIYRNFGRLTNSFLPASLRLVAFTNDPQSLLAQRAQHTLPLLVEAEAAVTTKTYLNSLAVVLWLLARRCGGAWNGWEFKMLATTVAEIHQLLEQAGTIAARWLDTAGHYGNTALCRSRPHGATARQATMIVSEWAKFSAPGASAGAFRHGFIESAGDGRGAVCRCLATTARY